MKVGKQMRVVFLRSNPVEPDTRVEKEANSLLKAGYEVEIVGWDRSSKYRVREKIKYLDSGKVKIHRIGITASYGGGIKKNLFPLFKFQIELYKWLYKNRKNFDIIHACDFDTAYTAYLFTKITNKKLVYDIFDYYVDAFKVPKLLRKLIESKDHKIINTANAVLICSEKRKLQIKGTKPKKLEVIHNTPADTKCVFNNLNLDSSKVKIVYVGILGDGRFIKEIAEIVMDNPDYQFHIGGFGKHEKYFEEISMKYSNIKFYGKLAYKDTLELESNCDIITAIYDPTVPNHNFAAPNKFYESLMLGKPLIMIENTGMDNVVLRNDIGEVIKYDSKSLADAIKNIVNRKSEWQEISLRMKKLYKTDYSWNEMEKRLIKLYRDISN